MKVALGSAPGPPYPFIVSARCCGAGPAGCEQMDARLCTVGARILFSGLGAGRTGPPWDCRPHRRALSGVFLQILGASRGA